METLANSFALAVSDRWREDQEPWPIKQEDPCRVEVDGETVIDGCVERRSMSIDSSVASISISGFDRSQALVRGSSLLEKWTFRGLSTVAFVRKVAAQYSVSVKVQEGLELPPPPRKYTIDPGDSPYDAILRATSMAGVLAVSDGTGGLVLTRTGATRAAPLLEGVNVKSARASHDASGRAHRYVVLAQRAGDDGTSGDATRVRGEAFDAGVRRQDRVRVIRPSRGMSRPLAQQRADWEARTRAGRAESGTIVVVGWRSTEDAPLWSPNTITDVQLPSVDLAGDMVITTVDLSIDDSGGEIAMLRLMRPDAFAPGPRLQESGLAR